jgi:hypothetical protein
MKYHIPGDLCMLHSEVCDSMHDVRRRGLISLRREALESVEEGETGCGTQRRQRSRNMLFIVYPHAVGYLTCKATKQEISLVSPKMVVHIVMSSSV